MITSICFTVTNDLSYDQRMIRICSTLADAGYQVELIGRKLKHSTPLDPRPYKQTRLNCWFSKGKLFYIEYAIRLFFYLLIHKADILSAVDLDTLLPNTIVSKIRSTKLVFDAHEYFTEVPEVYNRRITKAVWNSIGNLCIPHVDAAYTVGQSLADIFTTTYHKSFTVIRNVPQLLPARSPARTNPKPILFYQGDLNEGRGLEHIIQAMPRIDAELHIAGEGPLLVELRKLVQELELQHKIHFLGYIKPESLPELLSKATLGLNILENRGRSYYYSLANKFFAYIHAELPQICAPFPEYERLNASYEVAVLCECSSATLADTINNLLQDSSRYSKLQQNCRIAREHLNWQNESQRLIQVYRNVIA